MGVKSPAVSRGLANARPPDHTKLVKAPLPGVTRQANAPQLTGAIWAQLDA